MSDMTMTAQQVALDADASEMAAETVALPLWVVHFKIAALTAAGVLFSSALGVLLFLR